MTFKKLHHVSDHVSELSVRQTVTFLQQMAWMNANLCFSLSLKPVYMWGRPEASDVDCQRAAPSLGLFKQTLQIQLHWKQLWLQLPQFWSVTFWPELSDICLLHLRWQLNTPVSRLNRNPGYISMEVTRAVLRSEVKITYRLLQINMEFYYPSHRFYNSLSWKEQKSSVQIILMFLFMLWLDIFMMKYFLYGYNTSAKRNG